jgi:hypothetical protein
MAGAALLAFSALLALSFGVAASLLMRVRDGAGLIVATMIAAAAQLVLLTEVLSIFSAWSSGPLIALQVISVVPVAFFAVRAEPGRPKLPARPAWLSLRGGWELVRSHPVEFLTFAIVGILLLVQLVLAWRVPPNNYDSMTYHLTRILFWLQDDSVRQFANATERQATFPVNAEIIQGWTMMLSGGERFIQLVQWTAQLGLIAFVFAAAKDFGYRRMHAGVAACAMLTMPIMVAQATSSQNDLIVGFFAAAAALFLLRGLRGDNSAYVPAAIAAGLVVGTKSTGPLIITALGIGAIVYCGRDWRRLVRPAVLLLAGIVLLGSFNYVQNISDRGSLLGSDIGDKDRISKPCQLPSNALQFGWYSVASLPGFSIGSIEIFTEKRINGIPSRVALKLGCTDHAPLTVNHEAKEDRVSGGLPLLLLIFPAALVALFRRRSREEFALAVAASTLVALYIVLLLYNVWAGRFMLVPAAMAAPLVARLASRSSIRLLTLILVLVSMMTMTFQNATKPIYNGASLNIFDLPYVTQRTIPNPGEAGALGTVELKVPADGRLGIIGYEDSWEYPYAGRELDRELVRLSPQDLKPGVLAKYELDALLISRPGLKLSSEIKPLFEDKDHALVVPGQGL